MVNFLPFLSEFVDNVWVERAGFLHIHDFEALQDHCYEQVQENELNNKKVGIKVKDGAARITAPNRLVTVVYILLIVRVLYAFVQYRLLVAEDVHDFSPAVTRRYFNKK